MVLYELRQGLALGLQHNFACLQRSHMGQSVRSPLIRRLATETKPSTEIHTRIILHPPKGHVVLMMRACWTSFNNNPTLISVCFCKASGRMWSGINKQPPSAEISELHPIRNRTQWPISQPAFLPFHFTSPIRRSHFIYLHGDVITKKRERKKDRKKGKKRWVEAPILSAFIAYSLTIRHHRCEMVDYNCGLFKRCCLPLVKLLPWR